MSTFTWLGGNGSWSVGSEWNLLSEPGPDDDALLGGSGSYTVTIDAPAAVQDVAITANGATLDLLDTLTLGGTLLVAGANQFNPLAGALDLAGTLLGGTLDLSGGGALDAEGGTLDSTTLLGQFGTIGGGGALTNQGNIGWASVDGQGLIEIDAASFGNGGELSLVPVTTSETGDFPVSVAVEHGAPITTYGSLEWNQSFTASVAVNSASFANSGVVSLQGGTLSFTGASFVNTGDIVLADEPSQAVVPTGTTDGIATYGVSDVTLTTAVEIGAGTTTFDNAGGTISADRIVFDAPEALANLGTLNGAVTFDAGINLQGGTLDAGNVTINGSVSDGTIAAGTLVLNGATLDDVTVAPGASVQTTGQITLVDPPAAQSTITLNSTTTELVFSATASSDATVIAGSSSVTDVIDVTAAGGVTLGSAFSLDADVAGGSVVIGGAGQVVNDGMLSIDGGTLTVATTLGGTGTIALANGASAALSGVLAGSAPVVSFGAGTSRAVLPGQGALGVILSGLQAGDAVDFAAVSSIPDGLFGNGGAVASDGSLDVQGASGDSASVPLAGAAGNLTFTVTTDGSGGTEVVAEAACFAEGTRIATADGETPVEALRPGDWVRTRAGRVAAVRWVGWTRVDLSRHPAPERAAPIRILAEAFGEGLPRRDLLVSPEHCLFVDGALVPAFLLLNGATIARDDAFAAVTYWHVELDRHDVLLAEGLPAESYLDTGNRALFTGEAGVRALHPDLSGAPDAAAMAVWAERGCAPLRLYAVAARARLRRRAEDLGWQLCDDPSLMVHANGAALPMQPDEGCARLRLPTGTSEVRLVSQSFVPAEIFPGSGDTRRLGVAVAALSLAGWKLHPDAMTRGWHAARGEQWRWTNGDASVTIPKLARPAMLEFRLPAPGRAWRAPATVITARAGCSG